jgi:type 1 glutamine amidotransferase
MRSISRRTLLSAVGGLPLAAYASEIRAQTPSRPAPADARLLVFTRTTGYRHDSIPDGIAAIQGLGPAYGFAVDQTEDPALFNAASLASYRALIFLSTTGDLLEAPQQAALQQYLAGGGGFVGIHAAADAEYEWPWYGGLVGAYFDSHPDIQTASVWVEDSTVASTDTLPDPWVRTDEWYNFRTNPRATGAHVLLTLDEATYSGGSMGADHPIAWCREYGGGRTWYTAGGHTSESFAEPRFVAHLWGGIRYASGGF